MKMIDLLQVNRLRKKFKGKQLEAISNIQNSPTDMFSLHSEQ